jgi:hypothetical protein
LTQKGEARYHPRQILELPLKKPKKCEKFVRRLRRSKQNRRSIPGTPPKEENEKKAK